jgi:hypothetical protein
LRGEGGGSGEERSERHQRGERKNGEGKVRVSGVVVRVKIDVGRAFELKREGMDDIDDGERD